MSKPGPLCPECGGVVHVWPDFGSVGADCPSCGWEMGTEPEPALPIPPLTKERIERLRLRA